MPRKPFLGFYQPGMAYDIGPDAIAKRPELAALVGQCIAMWSDVELQMALSLGAILKTNSDAAVALFLAIKTSKAQRDALSVEVLCRQRRHVPARGRTRKHARQSVAKGLTGGAYP